MDDRLVVPDIFHAKMSNCICCFSLSLMMVNEWVVDYLSRYNFWFWPLLSNRGLQTEQNIKVPCSSFWINHFSRTRSRKIWSYFIGSAISVAVVIMSSAVSMRKSIKKCYLTLCIWYYDSPAPTLRWRTLKQRIVHWLLRQTLPALFKVHAASPRPFFLFHFFSIQHSFHSLSHSLNYSSRSAVCV